MSMNDGMMLLMAVGVLLGGLDCIWNNRWGLGEKFEEGFLCLGPTALSMVGIICLAPKLAQVLGPVLVPLYRMVGADPAMFASVLAIDMGGYPLAMALAENAAVGAFSGLIVSSMLGATIVFTIPVGLGMIAEGDRSCFARGLLMGVATVPVGAFLGGLMMGLPMAVVLCNLLPVMAVSVLLVLGLIAARERMIKGFVYFGRGIKIVTVIGLCAAAVEHMTGIVLISGITPIMEAMETVAGICIVLLGSLPLITLMLRILKKPFEGLGGLLGLDATSVGGILFAGVSVLPVFRLMKEMGPRGKVVVTAGMVSTISLFSAHLGFVMGTQPELLGAVMASKLCSGVLGITLALALTKHDNMEKEG